MLVHKLPRCQLAELNGALQESMILGYFCVCTTQLPTDVGRPLRIFIVTLGKSALSIMPSDMCDAIPTLEDSTRVHVA